VPPPNPPGPGSYQVSARVAAAWARSSQAAGSVWRLGRDRGRGPEPPTFCLKRADLLGSSDAEISECFGGDVWPSGPPANAWPPEDQPLEVLPLGKEVQQIEEKDPVPGVLLNIGHPGRRPCAVIASCGVRSCRSASNGRAVPPGRPPDSDRFSVPQRGGLRILETSSLGHPRGQVARAEYHPGQPDRQSRAGPAANALLRPRPTRRRVAVRLQQVRVVAFSCRLDMILIIAHGRVGRSRGDP